MTSPAGLPPTNPAGEITGTTPRQRRTTLGLLFAVVLLDQTTKWWAWRHAPEAIINPGSTWLIGPPVRDWFLRPGTGALIDLLSAGLLGLAAYLLLRRRRRGTVLVAGALMIGGWLSNLLDRLGMHTVTAPGSVRGAVDFIHVGRPYVNLADCAIAGAAVVSALAVCTRVSRSGRGVPAGAAPTG